MKQIVFKISCIVVCVSIMLSVFILSASAANIRYVNTTWSEPQVTTQTNFGYFCIPSTDAVDYFLFVDTNGNSNVTVNAMLNSNGNVFIEVTNNSSVTYDVTAFFITYDGQVGIRYDLSVASGGHIVHNTGFKCTGYQSFGLPIICDTAFTPLVYPAISFSVERALYLQLQDINSNTDNLESLINSLITAQNSSNSYLSSLVTRANTANAYLNNIDKHIVDLNNSVNNQGNSIQGILNSISTKIDNIFNSKPETELETDKISEFETAVDEVQSTLPEEDLSNIMGNVDMSGRSIEWIYQQLEDFVSGNNKVFSVYMAILSMSFIMFVLNKGSNVRGG